MGRIKSVLKIYRCLGLSGKFFQLQWPRLFDPSTVLEAALHADLLIELLSYTRFND